MPRYKSVHKGLMLLPVGFDKQIPPGSFEFALCNRGKTTVHLALT